MNHAPVFVARRPDRRAGWRSRIDPASTIQIERWDAVRNGLLTEAGLRRNLDAMGFETTSRLYSPGPIAAVHTDCRLRIQAVLSGEVRVTIDGESVTLTPGDAIFIPAGAIRCVEVVGSPAAYCLEGAYRLDAG
jgi:mannose-6-phosphate isomerase-like protein (cupin superfamily)